jgi:hypothetical protein
MTEDSDAQSGFLQSCNIILKQVLKLSLCSPLNTWRLQWTYILELKEKKSNVPGMRVLEAGSNEYSEETWIFSKRKKQKDEQMPAQKNF